MTMDNRVLIVASMFPPINRISAVRVGMFAKFLPDFGWTPQVVSGDWGYGDDDAAIDLNFLPETKKYVVDQIDARPRWATQQLLRMATGRGDREQGESVFYHAKQLLLDKWHPESDPNKYYDQILKRLPGIVEKNRPNVMFGTSPMRAVHAAMSRVSEMTGVPWVADFRDIISQVYSGQFERFVLRRRERKILRTASAVIGVTPAMVETLQGRFDGKVHLIPNGFSPDQFPFPAPECDKKFSVTYTGTLSDNLIRHRNPAMLFEAFDELFLRGTVNPDDCQVNFVGRVDRDAVMDRIGHCKSRSLAHFSGFVTRAKSTEYQQKSQLLLQLAHGKQKGILTGKIFEYLGAGRPMLSFPRDHDCVDALLNETSAGFVCDNRSEIGSVLDRCYHQWKRDGIVQFHGNPVAIGRYHRRTQTEQLAKILKSAVESPRKSL